MSDFSGDIFRGEIDQTTSIFYLNHVKNLHTASTLSQKQIVSLIEYLEKQSDTCTITVNDQIPMLLQQEEIELLLKELNVILREIG
ncbi:hypothetical protein SAMN05216389_12452 [Oceanobacillus limi]|uniref:Uncharacterized protein n=1 Tax=Oceanobacillus limi TaxID=930131 RepID=A0A1I0GWV2_9BACI|nr:hypothetical protein [Oceanobacillus limi]SET75012.1 hypothetical protein SAMN05216389_12452 [Oceanobacillus limi]